MHKTFLKHKHFLCIFFFYAFTSTVSREKCDSTTRLSLRRACQSQDPNLREGVAGMLRKGFTLLQLNCLVAGGLASFYGIDCLTMAELELLAVEEGPDA